MHEATIAQSILEIAEAKLRAIPNAGSVLSVHVIVGEFRNIDAMSLKFAFDSVKDLYNSCAECELEIETIEARAFCRGDSHLYHPHFNSGFRCEQCGEGIGKMLSGEELDVIGITLEALDDKEKDDYARVN